MHKHFVVNELVSLGGLNDVIQNQNPAENIVFINGEFLVGALLSIQQGHVQPQPDRSRVVGFVPPLGLRGCTVKSLR